MHAAAVCSANVCLHVSGPFQCCLSLLSLQVVPSLGQVKVLHRRLAAAAPQGGQGPAPFPQLATRWAAMHKGKVFTDQVRRTVGGGDFMADESPRWKGR